MSDSFIETVVVDLPAAENETSRLLVNYADAGYYKLDGSGYLVWYDRRTLLDADEA